jgi:non-ribosomal peptide synthetase component F
VRLEYAAGVRRMRRRLGATEFMLLVAAWAATLYRWSGESDIVLGTPMANRNRVELESLIGFFSNTVPLRVRIDGAQSFRELVACVSETALQAFDNQDLPFDRIVEAIDPVRDPRCNPLFQVNVRVHSGRLPTLDVPGLAAEPVHLDLGWSRFDLALELHVEDDVIGGYLEYNSALFAEGALELHVEDDVIGGYLEYNSALFAEGTARMIVRRLDMLLGAALDEPDRAIWNLPQPSAGSSARRRRTA